MPESIKLTVSGESAGTIEVIIDNPPTASELTATFIYTPLPQTPVPKEMLFGFRDSFGKEHTMLMEQEEKGQWRARKSMSPYEITDFFMHPDVKPGELIPNPNIKNKIILAEGKIVTAIYEESMLVKQMPQEHLKIMALMDSMPKLASGAIDLGKAERIAEGGTHVLYRFPDSPVVVKLMKQNPNPLELEELEKKYAVLYECFDKDGKNRCIREHHITLPVSLPGKDPQNAALSIVPYEECFQSKVKFDFKIEPAELDPYLTEHQKSLFDKSNKALIHKEDSGGQFEPKDYEVIDPRIGGILQRLDSDPQLREVMGEFLTHYRDFYQKTNIILDAMGWENILFYKDEQGDWQFKIGSAIKHDTGKYTNELFNALHSGMEVNLNDFFNLTHAYFSPANIRAVNVCAMKLGLAPVIHDVMIDSSDLFKVSHALSVPERMLAYARHGDFTKMEEILLDNEPQLHFSLRDFWAYALIADEYIKHGQPPKALKNYLDIVYKFPVASSENKAEVKQISDSKTAILDRKSLHEKKIMLHEELKRAVPPYPSITATGGKQESTATVTHNYKKQLQEARTELTEYPSSHVNSYG
ncbi:hypothetical protein OQJ15_11630 [Fluoribacter dumoffii]|uniref:Uncharacterized protein n=1 Tax=Fluoribacter dumoffii TaxID=463 RepID=A0A377G7A8_9GAMM|nr:hypothetical protein [Fluoribacter dumoffii]KTC92379.1 hypothetical protein Ldum_0185 [Fluoribacter dumoffii NY 23]MCW8386957.1 hypothetical protein [Fluoribacter dumoffii]MCW8497159.1 hypothetical protein [Fluoribacter dumoffii]STO20391.1 Uncharacterised protein [Fluoribacter dumoffii]